MLEAREWAILLVKRETGAAYVIWDSESKPEKDDEPENRGKN